MADYPDWTNAFRLVGVDVTVNIDITAASVTIPVSLASSAITLNINISSSSVTLNVNISASSITLNINISAQGAPVYVGGQWWALQGTFVGVIGSGSILNNTRTLVNSYVVPAGQTLFITSMGGVIRANAGNLYIEVMDWTAGNAVATIGGVGGSGLDFSTPMVFAAGTTIRLYAWQWTGGTVSIDVYFHGYLV